MQADTTDDKVRRAAAWVKAFLTDDAEAFAALGPPEQGPMEFLWRADPFRAAMIEPDVMQDRDLSTAMVALLLVMVAKRSGMGRDGLVEELDRLLSMLPQRGPE